MTQSAYASEQTVSQYWTVWEGNVEAGKEKYRTKARMSSALFTAGGTSERLSTALKTLWKCCDFIDWVEASSLTAACGKTLQL